MRKYILLSLLVILPFKAIAQVPTDVMGFMDGKLYTEEGSKTGVADYVCFMDGSCYDNQMNFAFDRNLNPEKAQIYTVTTPAVYLINTNSQPVDVSIPTPTPTPTPTPIPTPTPTPTPLPIQSPTPTPTPRATYNYNGSEWFIGDYHTVGAPELTTFIEKYRLTRGVLSDGTKAIVGWKKVAQEWEKTILDGEIISTKQTGKVFWFSYDNINWFLTYDIPHDTEIPEDINSYGYKW